MNVFKLLFLVLVGIPLLKTVVFKFSLGLTLMLLLLTLSIHYGLSLTLGMLIFLYVFVTVTILGGLFYTFDRTKDSSFQNKNWLWTTTYVRAFC